MKTKKGKMEYIVWKLGGKKIHTCAFLVNEFKYKIKIAYFNDYGIYKHVERINKSDIISREVIGNFVSSVWK